MTYEQKVKALKRKSVQQMATSVREFISML